MIQAFKAFSIALCLAVCSASAASAADPGVTLIGRGLVAGTLLDKSGLKGKEICRLDDSSDCIDQATFGGFGSALTYTGHDGVFIGIPDRGPFDGRTDVPYLDRFHFLHIAVDTTAPFPNITTTLLDPSYKVDATNTIKDVIAEKIEGLAWGPDLPDGRHVLYVISDNDLTPDLPTQIYAFAIDGSAAGANIDYEPQKVHCAMFPRDKVKKAIGHGHRLGNWGGDWDDNGHGHGDDHDDRDCD